MNPTLHPYPTYKPSTVPWLGDVPGHWQVMRLKALGHIQAGSGFPHEEQGDTTQEYPFFKVGDMAKSANSIEMEEHQHSISSNTVSKLRAFVFPPRTIVFAKVGAALMLNRRRMLVRPSCIDNNMMGLIPQQVLPAYMLRLMGTIDFGRFVNPGAVPSVNESQVGEERVTLPPPPEQRAIVRYLDYVDRRIRRYITAKQKLIELLEEEKRAIVNRTITRGLDSNVRLKPSRVEWLGDVPEHWEVRRAKFFYRESDERSRTGVEELMSVSHITGVTPRKKSVTMFMAESNMGYKLCRPGDIVINTMWAYMAALGVARQNGLVSPSYGVYRPLSDDHMDHIYIDSLLRTEAYKANYTIRSTGITGSRLRLYAESFLDVPLLCPPITEQNSIVEHLGQVTAATDAAITRASRQIELIEEYRTRLIADLVTGKLDVREAAAQLPKEHDSMVSARLGDLGGSGADNRADALHQMIEA